MWMGRLASVLAVLAVGAAGAAVDASTAPANAKRCRGVRAIVDGKATCLRVGQRCRRAFREDYARADLVCVRRGKRGHKRFVLRRAGLALQRHGRVLDLGSAGRPTFRQALWNFDHTVAPLPGVRVPRGAIGRERSGTAAIKSLSAYGRRLTRRQRTILRRLLKPRKTSMLIHPSGSGAAARSAAPRPGGDLTAIAQEASRRLAAHGVAFKHPISLHILPRNEGTEDAHTVAEWLERTGRTCAVSFDPRGLRRNLVSRRVSMLHELMHCAAAEQSPTNAVWQRQPKYLDEGLPEWGAYRVSIEWQGAISADSWWPTYLGSPWLRLRTREYDAVGWWSLVEHEGVNLWALLPSLVQAGGSGDPAKPYAVARAAAGGQTLDAEWGSTLATKASFGPRWDLDGPGMTPRSEPNKGDIGEGIKVAGAALAGGANEFRVNLQADVIAVRGGPGVEGFLRDPSTTDRPIHDTTDRYCTVEGGCECPDGTKLPYHEIPPGDAHVGFSASGKGGAVVLKGESIDSHCHPEPIQGIQVRQVRNSAEAIVATFKSGTCTVKNGVFTATATDGAWKLKVRIGSFGGYGKTYLLAYNSSDPSFVITGGAGPYSNAYHPPEYPPGGGAVVFDAKGTRMSLGFVEAFNADYSDAVLPVGAMRCTKPKK